MKGKESCRHKHKRWPVTSNLLVIRIVKKTTLTWFTSTFERCCSRCRLKFCLMTALKQKWHQRILSSSTLHFSTCWSDLKAWHFRQYRQFLTCCRKVARLLKDDLEHFGQDFYKRNMKNHKNGHS